ncbi:MAG TPA: hypothetical protein VKB84_18415 [Candidatus Binataceae bacterium]|nr:hypothetical protein [Candidatus Binataceae bacterium]
MPLQRRLRHPVLLAAAILAVAAAAGFSIAKIRALTARGTLETVPAWDVTQNDQDTENTEVSPAQVEQYLKVYQAMQRDRTLTVEQATAAQHMTVQQFRDIEGRIERDGVLRERVRRELLKTAQEKSNALKLKPQSAPSSTQP